MSEISEGISYADRVYDAKILDRLLEWTRTADEKAARLALIAVGLSLFWLYYGFLVPRTATHRVKLLEEDVTTVDGLIDRFEDLRRRYRDVALPKRWRGSATTYPAPFFVDVAIPLIESDPAVAVDDRKLAHDLGDRLESVAGLIEAYRTFVRLHPEALPDATQAAAAQPQNSALQAQDPTGRIANLIEVEMLMIDLQRINTTGANTDWIDSLQRAFPAKPAAIGLPSTFTGSLIIYEPLVGTWGLDANAPPISRYANIAAGNGEPVPRTLADLAALRDHLAESLTEARHELRVTRLRLPFTSIDVDRATVVIGVPILILLLFHYAAAYLLLASALGEKTGALWGMEAAILALDYRPSDAIFHRFLDTSALPRAARWLRDSLWLVVRLTVPVVPILVLIVAAFGERYSLDTPIQRYTWISVYVVLLVYAVVTALAFWRVIKRRSA